MNKNHINESLLSAMISVKEIVKHGRTVIEASINDYTGIDGPEITYRARNDCQVPKHSPRFTSIDECIEWLRNKHAPEIIPHTMETFPRDSWLKWGVHGEGTEYWRPSIVTETYVDNRGVEYSYGYLLQNVLVVMSDGTTKACGQEVAQ